MAFQIFCCMTIFILINALWGWGVGEQFVSPKNNIKTTTNILGKMYEFWCPKLFALFFYKTCMGRLLEYSNHNKFNVIWQFLHFPLLK